jgi:hypothetical protein
LTGRTPTLLCAAQCFCLSVVRPQEFDSELGFPNDPKLGTVHIDCCHEQRHEFLLDGCADDEGCVADSGDECTCREKGFRSNESPEDSNFGALAAEEEDKDNECVVEERSSQESAASRS